MKRLKEIPCGQTVKVTKLTGEGPVKRRYSGHDGRLHRVSQTVRRDYGKNAGSG